MENQIECYNCHSLKNTSEFCKSSTIPRGFQHKCRQCEKEYRKNNRHLIKERSKRYNRLNKDKIRAQKQEYRLKNIDRIKEANKNWRRIEKNRLKEKERLRLSHIKNREHNLQKVKNWRDNNRERYRTTQRKWKAEQRKNNPNWVIKDNLRRRIRYALERENTVKSQKTLDLLGCDISFLKNYLENQFQAGMSWENYGIRWEIDHKIACCRFDLTKEEEQRKCFHYSNLQPLWVEEHRIKSAQDKQLSLNNLENQALGCL